MSEFDPALFMRQTAMSREVWPDDVLDRVGAGVSRSAGSVATSQRCSAGNDQASMNSLQMHQVSFWSHPVTSELMAGKGL